MYVLYNIDDSRIHHKNKIMTSGSTGCDNHTTTNGTKTTKLIVERSVNIRDPVTGPNRDQRYIISEFCHL
jgi:hypothetical protein